MIVFRCAADSHIGLGHLTRCRALAQSLGELGQECAMFGPARELQSAEDADLFTEWIEATGWQTEESDANSFLTIARRYSDVRAVLDDYRIQIEYQNILSRASVPTLLFDGGQRQSVSVNLIVNANPEVSPSDYGAVAGADNARLLLGPQYATIRSELVSLRRREKSGVGRLLLMFGGGDDRGAAQFALTAIASLGENTLEIDLVLGRSNPNLEQIRACIQQLSSGLRKRVYLRVQPKNLPQIYKHADLGLFAGGTSTYEAAYFGLPMLLVSIAENQIMQCRAWEQRGAAIYLGALGSINASSLASVLRRLIESPDLLRQMSLSGSQLVDGHGARRVAEALMEI